MDVKEYESRLISKLEKIIESIINDSPKLDIAVKKGERVGDAISKFFEKSFVAKVEGREDFSGAEASPIGKTKNPWDARVDYTVQEFKQDIVLHIMIH